MRVKIPKTQGYEVSEEGRVYLHGKEVRVNSLESGYRVVNVRFDERGWRTVTLSNLVLEAFVGPRPAMFEARHVNGDPSDCSASNLRWEPRGKNRVGLPHHPDTLGHELKDRRRRKRETKKKANELKSMKRELDRLRRELGIEA